MFVSYDGREIQLPDFLIPGAARSGTTKLYDSLQRHSSVFMPNQKEPMFFSLWGGRPFLKEWMGKERIQDWATNELDAYVGLFRNAISGQFIGEGSVWYLYDHETVIENIQKLYGANAINLKIIILLRNPAARAWSHYLLKSSHYREPLPFNEAIHPETIDKRLASGMSYSYDYIGFGRYEGQVRAFMQTFPHCKVWIFEEFCRDLAGHMAEIADFLGIAMDGALLSGHVVNPSGRLRNSASEWLARNIMEPSWWKTVLKSMLPYRIRRGMKLRAWKGLTRPDPMPEDVRRKLAEVYSGEINRLETLLGRSLQIWRESA